MTYEDYRLLGLVLLLLGVWAYMDNWADKRAQKIKSLEEQLDEALKKNGRPAPPKAPPPPPYAASITAKLAQQYEAKVRHLTRQLETQRKRARKNYIAAQERDIMACDANKQAKYVRILKQSLCRVALRGGQRIVRR